MKTLRVIQLTDTHLLATAGELLYGVDSGAALADAIRSIQTLSPLPDAIVMTGDIAQDGQVKSYQRVKELLDPLNLPVYVLPGNHDVRSNMQQGLVNNKIQLCTDSVIGNWRWLFLDSTVSGKDHGELSQTALGFIFNQLENDQKTPTMIAIHHSPTFACSAFDCQLQNRDEFINLLKQYQNVKGVIAGHVHCDNTETLENLRLMATPSTFLHVEHHSQDPQTDHSDVRLTHTIDDKKRAYRILDLHGDGGFDTQVRWF